MQNGFVESFNGRMRDELLNEIMFRNLAHARIVVRDWAHDYKITRPHSALGYETLEAFAERLIPATDCNATPLESSAQPSVAKPARNGVSTKGSGSGWMTVQGQVRSIRMFHILE